MKSVTGAEFCRALARDGWQLVRTRGKKGRGSVTVPVHAGRDLGRGLLAALLKQSGLAEEDF